MALLEVNNLSKNLDDDTYAVQGLSLSVKQRSKVGIVGETGSGKSTLLRLISGLEQKDSGTILFDGKKVKGPEEKLIAGHSEMQYLSQYFELPEFITVEECLDNIYLIAEEEAKKIYKACQIVHLLSKDTRHLSGGEKQRVALARALTHEPQLLLLDEPFSNLDFQHEKQMKEVLDQVQKELSTTMILVSHDPKDVLSWADEIIVMRKGKVAQQGSPKEIYERPVSEYVAGLFGSYHLVDPEKWNVANGRNFPVIKRKILVRPEQFTVSKKEEKGVQGVVTKVRYHGSYDEVHIETSENLILTRSSVKGYDEGDQITLTLKDDK